MNKSKNQRSFFLKIWPIYALISGLLFALYQGWDQYLTPRSLGLHAVDLNTLVENNFWNPLSYLFSLRLIPLFPFAVVNIAPAILGARVSHYFISTLFGIIPGTLAYTLIGTGLRDTLLNASASGESLDVSLLVENAAKNFIPAFFALSLLALMPVVYKYIKKNNKLT